VKPGFSLTKNNLKVECVKDKTIYKRLKKRNTVVQRALVARPTLEAIRAEDACCPLCGAEAENLALKALPALRKSSFMLACLGIQCSRWVRGLKTVECQACESQFQGPSVLRWNVAVSLRRFSDFGQTRLPLPSRRRSRPKGSLEDQLQSSLKPGKRRLVNLRLQKGLLSKPKRANRQALAESWHAAEAARPFHF
jgi:hypothetical protein